MAPYPEVSKFWEAYLKETFSKMKKADFTGALDRMLDLYQNYLFSKNDLDNWAGKMLILDSDEDPMVSDEYRDAVLELYPMAEHHRFEGTGHAASIIEPDKYIRVVKDFLLGE